MPPLIVIPRGFPPLCVYYSSTRYRYTAVPLRRLQVKQADVQFAHTATSELFALWRLLTLWRTWVGNLPRGNIIPMKHEPNLEL